MGGLVEKMLSLLSSLEEGEDDDDDDYSRLKMHRKHSLFQDMEDFTQAPLFAAKVGEIPHSENSLEKERFLVLFCSHLLTKRKVVLQPGNVCPFWSTWEDDGGEVGSLVGTSPALIGAPRNVNMLYGVVCKDEAFVLMVFLQEATFKVEARREHCSWKEGSLPTPQTFDILTHLFVVGMGLSMPTRNDLVQREEKKLLCSQPFKVGKVEFGCSKNISRSSIGMRLKWLIEAAKFLVQAHENDDGDLRHVHVHVFLLATKGGKVPLMFEMVDSQPGYEKLHSWSYILEWRHFNDDEDGSSLKGELFGVLIHIDVVNEDYSSWQGIKRFLAFLSEMMAVLLCCLLLSKVPSSRRNLVMFDDDGRRRRRFFSPSPALTGGHGAVSLNKNVEMHGHYPMDHACLLKDPTVHAAMSVFDNQGTQSTAQGHAGIKPYKSRASQFDVERSFCLLPLKVSLLPVIVLFVEYPPDINTVLFPMHGKAETWYCFAAVFRGKIKPHAFLRANESNGWGFQNSIYHLEKYCTFSRFAADLEGKRRNHVHTCFLSFQVETKGYALFCP